MYIVKVFIIIEVIRKYKVIFDLKEYYVMIVENILVGLIIFIVCVVFGCVKVDEIF